MQIKIGQIYKVKPEFRDVCMEFCDTTNSVYIRYESNKTYEILDEYKEYQNNCSGCFKPEHLEPLEKTLYNLETNDFIEDGDGDKRKILGLIESSPENPIYVISERSNYENFGCSISTKQLEKYGYKVVQPEPEEPIIEVEGMTQNVKEFLKIIKKGVKEMVEETSKVGIQEIINLKKAREYTYNQAIDDVLDLLKNN